MAKKNTSFWRKCRRQQQSPLSGVVSMGAVKAVVLSSSTKGGSFWPSELKAASIQKDLDFKVAKFPHLANIYV